MPQLLHLQNGESVIAKIRAADGRLATMLQRQEDRRQIVEELFLATLSRMPTEANRTAVGKALAADEGRDEVFRDLFWALVNSKEFCVQSLIQELSAISSQLSARNDATSGFQQSAAEFEWLTADG